GLRPRPGRPPAVRPVRRARTVTGGRLLRRRAGAGGFSVLPAVRAAGGVAAPKDVSMAGLVGSLAMLLECNRLGVILDLDALPVPAGVSLERWITCFPCLSFLMGVPPGLGGDGP